MKSGFALVVLSLFASLYADEAPAPAAHAPVMRKCPLQPPSHCSNVTFEVFGNWLYLQPNGSDLYYAAEAFPYDTSIAQPAVSPNWKIFEVQPGFHSAFEVGINFLLPYNDMNIELNWERFRAHDVTSMKVTPLSVGTGNMVGPIYDIGPNSAHYKQARGSVHFDFDEVNLFVGKSICAFKDFTLRLYLGASFAAIDQKMKAHYANSDAQTARQIESISSYWGIGPQMGLDLYYQMVRDFYLTGNSVISLYMGRIRNHTTFKSDSPDLAAVGVAEPNVQRTRVPNRTQVIPGFEERLGFAYMHGYKKWQLNFEIGYLFQIYLNAVQSVDMLTQALPNFAPGDLPTMGVFAVTFNRTLSNFILSGPYASLKLDF
ncbi:MAG: hypothetical protein JSS10_09285 [Verrucomicrobia bacterium]|nr:hypothetical protein [Verrucomicrobiota bacterium]